LRKTATKTFTPEQYSARFGAEKAVMQRAYCNFFEFWRTCRISLPLDPGYADLSHRRDPQDGKRIGGKLMRRAVALTVMLFAIIALALPSGARASSWTCQAESLSGSASGGGGSRQEAEDRALGNCAAHSARFAICRIVICRRGR